MRNRMRIYAALLAILILAGSVFSCSDTGMESPAEQTTGETAPVTEAVSTSELEGRKLIPDNLPETDFEGRDFRIYTRESYLYEVYTEEEDGEIINDALFARNRSVEERFNTSIKAVTTAEDSNASINSLVKAVSAGDNAYDLSSTIVYTSGAVITNGIYLNILSVPYIDLSREWWINGINDKFRIEDSVYTVVGDMCISTLRLTYAIYYNKRLGKNYMMPDLYQEVRDNKWTIDRMIALTTDVYSDINGDGIRDSGDEYGFAGETATNLDVYTFAFDIPIISRGDTGLPVLALNTPKTLEAVDKINTLYWSTGGSYICEQGEWGNEIGMFKNGSAMFATTWLGQMFGTFREMDDDYGVLPYPKWDESQEKYLTGSMDNYSVLGIPKTATDVEFVGIITEALNSESYKQLFPVYFEQALQTKYARDEGTIEMLEILMEGRNFDMVTLFSSQISGMPWLIRELVAKKSTDFASSYAKNETAAQNGLDKVIEAYLENA